MRVIECDICGEPISAATDAELVDRLSNHLASEHDLKQDRETVAATVEAEAYEATDS